MRTVTCVPDTHIALQARDFLGCKDLIKYKQPRVSKAEKDAIQAAGIGAHSTCDTRPICLLV